MNATWKTEKGLATCHKCKERSFKLLRSTCGHMFCSRCITATSMRGEEICENCSNHKKSAKILACKYKESGCEFKGNRKEIEKHEDDGTLHMKPLLNYATQQLKKTTEFILDLLYIPTHTGGWHSTQLDIELDKMNEIFARIKETYEKVEKNNQAKSTTKEQSTSTDVAPSITTKLHCNCDLKFEDLRKDLFKQQNDFNKAFTDTISSTLKDMGGSIAKLEENYSEITDSVKDHIENLEDRWEDEQEEAEKETREKIRELSTLVKEQEEKLENFVTAQQEMKRELEEKFARAIETLDIKFNSVIKTDQDLQLNFDQKLQDLEARMVKRQDEMLKSIKESRSDQRSDIEIITDDMCLELQENRLTVNANQHLTTNFNVETVEIITLPDREKDGKDDLKGNFSSTENSSGEIQNFKERLLENFRRFEEYYGKVEVQDEENEMVESKNEMKLDQNSSGSDISDLEIVTEDDIKNLENI